MSLPPSEKVLGWTLTLAAVVMAATVTVSELRAIRSSSVPSTGAYEPRFVTNWRGIATAPPLTGSPNAEVRLVEFSDLECPACRMFHARTLPIIREKFGDRVAIQLVHLPLPNHRFAVQSARAAVCAEEQGKAAVFIEGVFEKQDSIGLKPWAQFAREAGVSDDQRFQDCLGSSRAAARVDEDNALASRLALRATPTVMVNGWIVNHDQFELVRVIEHLLENRNPFPEIDSVRVRRIGD